MKNRALYTAGVVLLGLALVFIIPACGKKDADTPQYVATPQSFPNGIQGAQQGCPNCGALNTPLLVGIQTSTYSGNIRAGLDLYGDPNTGVILSDPKAIVSYRGPVQMTGYMVIQQNGDFRVCNAPAGEYYITSQGPGQSTLGSFGQFGLGAMVLDAVSQQTGSRITMQLLNGVVYNNDGGGIRNGVQTNRAGLNLYLQSVNGQPCGTLATY